MIEGSPRMPLHVRAAAKVLDHVASNRIARGLLLRVARLNLFSEWLWRKLPVHGEFAVRLPDGGSFRYRSRGVDALARRLFWMGANGVEAETVPVFCELARRSSLLLDIGANTGLYTLLACAVSPEIRVIAFEPVPHVHARLLENLELNRWTGRCEPRQEAVSSAAGSTEFHVADGEVPTSSSLHRDGFRGYAGHLIPVRVTTVDAVCSAGERPDLVKIDVEGFEHEVLKGMRGVLGRCAPTLIFECHKDGHPEEIEAILRPFGYRFWALRARGPVAVDGILPDPKEKYWNFLAAPHSDWRPSACP